MASGKSFEGSSVNCVGKNISQRIIFKIMCNLNYESSFISYLP